MEAISFAKAVAARTGQRIYPDQELIGQGLANITGSFAQSFPSVGSFECIQQQTHRGENEKQCPLMSVRTVQDH